VSNVRNTDIILDPGLLTDFAHCRYKAAQRISVLSCPTTLTEIETIQEYQRERLKERWHPTANDGYEAFNGIFSSFGDFRRFSVSVFGNVRLTYDGLQCNVDGIDARSWTDGRQPTYSPILISLSSQPSVLVRKTLALASIIIGKFVDATPQKGTIIAGAAQQRVAVNLAIEIPVLEKAIREMRRMIPNADKEPFSRLNKHCSECVFSGSCRNKAVEVDHLSLLSGISDKELKKLNEKGIFSVTQLSYTFRPRRSKKIVPMVKNNYALRALAIREKKTYIVQRPILPAPNTLVFLDIEGLPDRNFFYLIGLLVIKDGERRVFQFWADSESDQERIWRQFIEVIEAIDDVVIFHHGNYDNTFIKKMNDQYGDRCNQVNEKLVNALSLLYGKVYFPTYSNGLKEISALLGFNWSVANASGIQSIAWRLQWEEYFLDEFKDRILKYNREDCEALSLLVAQLKSYEEEPRAESVILCENLKRQNLYRWGRNVFAFPELEFVNSCAYFDYQHEKIFWRTNDEV
jgi:predicted RecB family nuclease